MPSKVATKMSAAKRKLDEPAKKLKLQFLKMYLERLQAKR